MGPARALADGSGSTSSATTRGSGPAGAHRAAHDAYVAWLAAEFGLTPPDDPDAIVAAATERYGKQFAEWHERYLPT